MKSKFAKLTIIASSFFPFISNAQESLDALLQDAAPKSEKVIATFKSGNLINGRTIETIHKGELDFRVDHRFGDIAGSAGGAKNFFGLDNSTDIRIGFDYGLSDNLNLGIARAKGATEARQLYEGNIKYRLLEQTEDDKMPFSMAIFGSATLSAMKASEDLTASNSYNKFNDRLTYVSQVIIARKFNTMFSFQVLPTYVHRNYTSFGDQNSMFAFGFGGRLKLSKRIAIVADYFLPMRALKKKVYIEKMRGQKFYNPLGLGLEIETGGHVFQMNFTNATAIQESQFIPETTGSWSKGQFRWGFSIARRFSFDKKK